MCRSSYRAALTIPLSFVMAASLQGQTPPASGAKRPVVQRTAAPPLRRPAPAPTSSALGEEIVVVVNDKGIEAPNQVEAGLLNVRLFNRSSSSQHISVLKVDRLDRLTAIADYLRSGNWNVPWINRMGGPESTGPGGVSSVSMVLEPGRYVIAQLPTSQDPEGPMILGSLEELSVVRAETGIANALPPAETTITLNEFAFDIAGPLHAGRRTIRVNNVGQLEHQFWLVRLASGKGLEQAVKWAERPTGAPPFEGIGGTTHVGRGRSVNVTADLLPGDYALLCVTYNPLSKRQHSQHGMMKALRVMP